MDRQAIVRAQRRRQALEALEFERARAAALREQLEAIVAELDGPGFDEAVFARLAPEDVEVVRPTVQVVEPEQPETDWPSIELEPDLEPAFDLTEHLEAELVRLEEEMATSRQRQEAFERYLAELAGDSSADRPRPAGGPPTA